MLLEINVKDIALIRRVHMECGGGLNIMTGETGAGKSIIIGSAMMAAGGRAPKDVIRTGADSALVELVFGVEERLWEQLMKLDVTPDEDGILVVSRKITPARSIFRLNDETVTAAKVKAVCALLIDIYGQNEQQTLSDPARHLKILDEYLEENARKVLQETAEKWKAFREAREAFLSFDLDEKERLREADLAAYEISEIENARLREGEEEELSLLYRKLNHGRSIRESLSEGSELLRELRLDAVIGSLRDALRYDASLQPLHDQLMDAQAICESCERDINGYLSDLEDDEKSFQETEERLNLVRSVMAKYGRTVSDVLEYCAERKKRLSDLEKYEKHKEHAARTLQTAEAELRSSCGKLRLLRKQAAEAFVSAVLSELKDLGFGDIRLQVRFEEKEPSADGADVIRFMAALNPGEPLLPMDEAASGGELSRIMLAVKTVLADRDDIPTLIFDEIDTGISGRTAQKVAEKMKKISCGRQVFSITHLPQIAAMADTHFVIEKTESEGRNVTEIRKLDDGESVSELARMLGGARITEAVLNNAAEMKRLAGRKEGSQ